MRPHATPCSAHAAHTRPHAPPPSFLEEELARRYREAAPATLALLQERCEAVAQELLALEGRIKACADVAALRRAGEALCCFSCMAGRLHLCMHLLQLHAIWGRVG